MQVFLCAQVLDSVQGQPFVPIEGSSVLEHVKRLLGDRWVPAFIDGYVLFMQPDARPPFAATDRTSLTVNRSNLTTS